MCGHRLPKTDGNDDNADDNVGDGDVDDDGDACDDENEDKYLFSDVCALDACFVASRDQPRDIGTPAGCKNMGALRAKVLRENR